MIDQQGGGIALIKANIGFAHGMNPFLNAGKPAFRCFGLLPAPAKRFR
jgi:hypothetical protein